MSGAVVTEGLAEGALGSSLGRAAGKALVRRGLSGALGLLSGPVGWGIMGALTLYDGYQLYNAYNESHKTESAEEDTKPAEECTGDCNQAKKKKQEERIEEEKEKGNVKDSTRGRHEEIDVEGGTSQDAEKFFDELDPANVKNMENGGRYGQLEDGSFVNVRPNSKSYPGEPTIQIQRPNGGKDLKFRYHPSGKFLGS